MTQFNSQLIDDVSVPQGMEIEAGSPFQKVWRVKNTGNSTWQGCRLMLIGGTIPTSVTWHSVPTTKPGQTADLSLDLSLPGKPDSYNSTWRLHNSAGQPFGKPLEIKIEAIAGGANNGRIISYNTNGNSGMATIEGGSKYKQTLVLENSGGRRWRNTYKLSYLGGDATATQNEYPLPATIPGEHNELTIELTANRTHNGVGTSYWQLRDQDGVPFGGFIAPEITILGKAQAERPFEPQKWRTVIWDITGIFESGRPGGNPAAYQNRDSGIVSYGAHQVTLSSGNLGRVLGIYFQKSNTPTSQALQNQYFARVQQIDANLRHDTRFRDLLLQAANEQAMVDAQDDVFAEGFYNPSVEKVKSLGLRTPLGTATIYDTRIQHGGGGLNFLIGLTDKAIGGRVGDNNIDEASWLAVFMDEREALLNRLADKSDRNGDTVSGNFLRTSTFRVRELRGLLTADNLDLAGTFKVRGHSINGLNVNVM